MAYGAEAMNLVELGVPLPRTDTSNVISNDKLRMCEIDFLKRKWG